MKKIAILVAVSFLSVAVAYSQTEPKKSDANKKEHKMDKKHEGKHAEKMMYECPMKCVPASDKPGKCSKCKMDLVAVKQKHKKH